MTRDIVHLDLSDDSIRDRLRVAVAEYEGHRERVPDPDSDPDASWWYAAWGDVLVPILKELLDTAPDRNTPA